MKQLHKILIYLIFASFLLTGCNDMLKVDSDRFLSDDQYQMKSPSDTLYALFGIFSKLQNISENYVLLGELRGDLLDVSDNANLSLREINNFEITNNNKYVSGSKDYYSIINNCNYVIHYIDTAYENNGVKVMYRTYAAVKAIRAWTYMQMTLNFGKAKYYDNPITTIEEANRSYPEYTINELAPKLIEDLKPWKNVIIPGIGSIGDYNNTEYSYFPIRFLLGDLYLWMGDYENAATEYHDLMSNGNYILGNNSVTASSTGGVFIGTSSYSWLDLFDSQSRIEKISIISASTKNGLSFDLDSLGYYNAEVKPSSQSLKYWNSRAYYPNIIYDESYYPTVKKYFGALNDTVCDLRMRHSVFLRYANSSSSGTSSLVPCIYKYTPGYISSGKDLEIKKVNVYRTALLYLRYAEAVNRLGKPNLAFAVLKTGLKSGSLLALPSWEWNHKTATLPNYMDFNEPRFTSNVGTMSRGLGATASDTTVRIPKTMNDSLHAVWNAPDSTSKAAILFVEDEIVKELARETAFEGNRFHDLMRFAIRRDDNAYLADKVAAKHGIKKAAIKDKLMIRENWYLKK